MLICVVQRVRDNGAARYFETAELADATESIMRELRHLICTHPESARVIGNRTANTALKFTSMSGRV